MKKTLKLLLVVAFMAVVLFTLTGCGDKLVATREAEEMGMKWEEEVEIKFKGDKVDSVKMTYTFDDKEAAESMKALLNLGLEDTDMEIKQSGKKVIMELDAKAYAEMAGEEDVEISKDELKEELEEEGYKVK